MIVAYLTESYYDWAELFLKSWKLTNDNDEKIYLNTRNLNNKQIKNLKSIYSNVIIENKKLLVEDLSKKHNISENIIKISKNDCDAGKIAGKHRLWMNITADGDRIESLLNVIKNNRNTNEKYFIHMDIDSLFRGKINEIINGSIVNDVGLIIRKNREITDPAKLNIGIAGKNKDSLIAIGCVCIGNTDNGQKFVEEWVKIVNSKPMKSRNHLKWGQYAILQAFINLKNKKEWKWFRLPYGRFNAGLTDKKHATVWYFKKKNKKTTILKARSELKRMSK